MSLPRQRRRWTVVLGAIMQFLRVLFWVFLLGCVLTLAYLSAFDFPDWLVARVRTFVNSGPVALDAARMQLHLPFGIAVDDARVFWKGRIGPPAAEARHLTITINPAALWKRAPAIRSMTIYDGVFRPNMIQPSSESSAEIKRAAAKPGPLPIRMRLSLRNCEVWGQHAETLSCLLTVDGPRIAVLNLRAVLKEDGRTGQFSGEFRVDSGSREFTSQLHSVSDPRILLPIMAAHRLDFLSELTQRFEFQGPPPDVSVQFRTLLETNAPFVLTGSFAARNCSYVGVPCNRVDGQLLVDLTPTSTVVRIEPLQITRDEGMASGGFAIVNQAHRRYAEFDASSSIEPKALTRMIGIMTNGFWDVCSVKGPYGGWARGYVNYENISDSDFHGQLQLGSFGNSLMTLQNCTCNLSMTGATIRVENIRAAACGGTVTGDVAVILATGSETDTLYRVIGGAEGVDWPTLVREIGKADPSETRGRLAATFDLGGVAGPALMDRMKGTGSIRVKNGRIFSLPVFGGFSKFMARIIPGLDFVLRQTDLKTSFKIADGKVSSDEVRIEGDVLSLKAKGAYGFDRSVDFDVQVQLMKQHTLVAKLLNVATYPITKLFEMKLTGTLDAPRWRAVNLSLDVLDKLGLKGGGADEKRQATPGEAESFVE